MPTSCWRLCLAIISRLRQQLGIEYHVEDGIFLCGYVLFFYCSDCSEDSFLGFVCEPHDNRLLPENNNQNLDDMRCSAAMNNSNGIMKS